MAIPDPQLDREGLAAGCRYGLRHRFVQDGADDSAMDDTPEALPFHSRRPLRRRSRLIDFVANAESGRMRLTADETLRLPFGPPLVAGALVVVLLAGAAQVPQF